MIARTLKKILYNSLCYIVILLFFHINSDNYLYNTNSQNNLTQKPSAIVDKGVYLISMEEISLEKWGNKPKKILVSHSF